MDFDRGYAKQTLARYFETTAGRQESVYHTNSRADNDEYADLMLQVAKNLTKKLDDFKSLPLPIRLQSTHSLCFYTFSAVARLTTNVPDIIVYMEAESQDEFINFGGLEVFF